MTQHDPTSSLGAADFARHSQWMRRLARGLLSDSEADDVVQDAWLKVRAHGAARRSGYLAAVVRSLSITRHRADERRHRREHAVARAEALPSAAETAARTETARRLAQALDELQEPYRTTLTLHYFDEISCAEIARRTGLPAATVRTRLRRGLERLRARLDEGGGGRDAWVGALAPLACGPRPGRGLFLSRLLLPLVAMKTLLLALTAAIGAVLLFFVLPLGGAGDNAPAVVSESAASGPGARSVSAGEPAAALEAEPARTSLAGSAPAATTSPGGAAPLLDAVLARAVDGDGRGVGEAWLHLALQPDEDARAAPDGRLVLALEPGTLPHLRELTNSHSVTVYVGAPGRTTRRLSARLSTGTRVLELGEVVLRSGGALTGHVRDADGAGVEEALVVFGEPLDVLADPQDLESKAAAHRRYGPPDLHSALSTRTGPGGLFRLEGLPAGYGTLWARTEESLWTFTEPIGLREGEERGGLELVVTPAPEAVIAGVVRSPDGEPLPGVLLHFERSAGSMGWNERRTDHHGRFHFVPPGGDAQDITVTSPRWDWEMAHVEEVAPGTPDLEVRFRASAWVHVEVRGSDGERIRGGLVTGLPASGPTEPPLTRSETALDSDGKARLRRPDEPLRIRVEGHGYRARIVGPFAPEQLTEPLVVTLDPVPALVGVVRDAEGRPAEGARVRLHRAASDGVPADDAPPGKHFTHQAWNGDREAFLYTMRPECTAETVTDEEGRFRLPLPGAHTTAAGEVEAAPEPLQGRFYRRFEPRISEAKPGSAWYVHAEHGEAGAATSGPHVLATDEDATHELHLGGTGAIRGRLDVGAGATPLGWTVYACDGGARVLSCTASSDGAFHFDGLRAGDWQIRAFEPGRIYVAAGGRVRSDRVPQPDVRVEEGAVTEYVHVTRPRYDAVLRGRLLIDGRPGGALRVKVSTRTRQAAYEHHETTLDPDGRFEVPLRSGLDTAVDLRGLLGTGTFWLFARVEIEEGPNEWSYDLQTATLEGNVPPERLPERTFTEAHYEFDEHGVCVRVPVHPDRETGRFGPLTVPAGPGVLHGPKARFDDPHETWSEITLAPGEEGRVAVP